MIKERAEVLSRMSRIGLLVIALLAFSLATSILHSPVQHSMAQTESLAAEYLSPHPEIQAYLASLISPNEEEMFDGDKQEIEKKLSELEKMVGGDNETLIRELLYFSLGARNMREAMLPGVLIKQMGISRVDLAGGLVPLLDARDENLREKVLNWLGEVESDPTTGQLDFGPYADLILVSNKSLPESLITYMFKNDPEEALESLAGAYLLSRKADNLLERISSMDMPEALDMLSRRTDWWAQRYVAEKIQSVPRLSSPELRDRLERSEHALVRRALTSSPD